MLITIFSFLSILMIFVRLYSMNSVFSITREKNKFSERITVFVLIFEILTIGFFVFFSSFRYLLPPALLFLRTRQFHYLIFENLSVGLIVYVLIDFFLLSTFYPLNHILKFFNRTVLTFVFLLNILLGTMMFMI